MRLVTIDSREVGGRPGVLVAGSGSGPEILDLLARPGTLAATSWLPQSVVSVLAAGEDGLARIGGAVRAIESLGDDERQALRAAGTLLPLSGTVLLPPVRRPGLMLLLEDVDDPLRGTTVKSPNGAVGHDSRVAVPGPAGGRVRVGARTGLVLGRPLFRPVLAEAVRAFAGITLVADLSVPGTDASGQFPGACPLGPVIATRDELPRHLPVRQRVNGHVVAESAVDLDPERVGALLTRIAQFYALRPGDIVALPALAPLPTAGAGDGCEIAAAELPPLSFSLA